MGKLLLLGRDTFRPNSATATGDSDSLKPPPLTGTRPRLIPAPRRQYAARPVPWPLAEAQFLSHHIMT